MSIFKIETERLILRDYALDDWERLHVYASDPEFSQYESWGPNSVEDTKKFIGDMILQASGSPRHKYDLAVCLKDSGLFIGGCGIRIEAEVSAVANLGWAITPACQGKGYATECAKGIIQFGFNQLKLKVIYATCDSRNTASIRVMEKAGMKRVGLIKGERVQKGHLRDTYRYEITRG